MASCQRACLPRSSGGLGVQHAPSRATNLLITLRRQLHRASTTAASSAAASTACAARCSVLTLYTARLWSRMLMEACPAVGRWAPSIVAAAASSSSGHGSASGGDVGAVAVELTEAFGICQLWKAHLLPASDGVSQPSHLQFPAFAPVCWVQNLK